jgi:hypothetical protein
LRIFRQGCFNRVEPESSVILLFERDLFGKTGFHFSGSCARLGLILDVLIG